ncbi:prominin-1-A-like [Asterias rubens]|uniref:prominin-1-A-like n=1 Tax=Asterias rubens TaxID=7604 RepID=UPI00145544AF|nr:prominin-1-A-like [Asterias rubens]
MATAVPLSVVAAIIVILCGVDLANAANSNDGGNLTLDTVPNTHTYNADGEYDEGGFPLPSTWGLVDSFLHTISPAPPPYALVNSVLGGEAVSVELITSSFSQLSGNLMGFVICFALGALFCIIFPIVCSCFCCCRCCCKNCGGKMYQKEGDYDRIKRVVFGFLLVLCVGFIVGGVFTAFCVNSFTTNTVETLPTDVINNIDDMVDFVSNTLEEINFIVSDQLNYTLDQITTDLTNIDQLVGVPVQQDLATNVQPAIDAIYPLADSITDTLNALNSVNTTQADVETKWLEVKALVDQALIDINAACGTCGCCSGGSWPDITGLSMLADWRDIDLVNGWGTFPQDIVDTSIQEMISINNANLTQAADMGASSFNSLPEVLKNTTESEIDNIVSLINGLGGSISGLLDGITTQLSGVTDQVDGIKDTINDFAPIIQEYDPYRSYVLIAFYSVLLVIGLLFIFGLLFGVFGYNKEASPSRRGGCSHCGGVFMMAGVGIAFIFLTFFMVFTMLLFVIGGPVDRLICDPIISGELFAETIDKPGALGPGYFLGSIIGNENISLTMTGLLDDCENDRAAFEAFKLDSFLNVTGLLDYQQFLPNISNDFNAVVGDLTSINILTADTRQILIDFRDSPADTIDWTLFKDELAKDLTNDVNDPNDLSVVAALLSTFAGTLSDGDIATFQGFADDLDGIQTDNIAPLLSQRDVLSGDIATLESATSPIDMRVNDTIAAADVAQNYLDTTATSFVISEINNYEDRILGYPDQFVTYALLQIQTEIGKCRPIYNLWSSSINIFCRGFLESVNALWLIMGWCIFFLIPATIFGVKLAKHYRRMEYDDSEGSDMEMMVHNGGSTKFQNNKVGPEYA